MHSQQMQTPFPQRDSVRMSTEQIITSITILDPLGLHLRVGKDLVKVANQYQCHHYR